jgi:hypothetical protein
VEQYRSWILQQYTSVKSGLFCLMSNQVSELQLASIRTIIEVLCRCIFVVINTLPCPQLVKRENLASDSKAIFKMSTYYDMIESLVRAPALEIDVLLMLREEVKYRPQISSITQAYRYSLTRMVRILHS